MHTFTKTSLFMGIVFSFFLNSSAQQDDNRLDSVYSFQFTSAQDSVATRKNVCSFSNFENTGECYNFSSCITSDWESQSRTWAPRSKFDVRSEDEGKKVTSISYSWHVRTQSWQPKQRTFRIKIAEIEENNTYNWDTLAISWVHTNARKDISDAAGRIIYNDSKTFNEEDRSWQGSQETHVFDDLGQRIEYTYANWDREKDDWHIEQKYSQSYTTRGEIAERIHYYWDNIAETWESGSIETYTYNDEGLLTRLEINSGGSKRIDEYTYNEDGWELSFQRSYQQRPFSPPQVEERRFQSYAPSGKILIREVEKWDFDVGVWNLQSREEYRYNSLDQLISLKEFERDFLAQRYYFKEEKNYTYGSSGNLTQDARKRYNLDGNIWGGDRTDYTYDALDRRIGRTTYYWNLNKQDWVLKQRNDFPSDSDGQVYCYAWLVWDEQLETWTQGTKTGLDYNEEGILTHSYRAFWRPQQNDWFTTSSNSYYYGACVKENLLPERPSALQIYPNPASEPWIFVETELESPLKYEILDFQGRKLIAGEMDALLYPIEIKQLPNGAYFIRCTSGDKSESRKFLVARP